MKQVIVIILLLPIKLFSQHCIVSMDRQDEIYLMDNYFDFHIDGISMDSVYVSTDNGKIEFEYGHYRIIPKTPGSATIQFYNIINKDTILRCQKSFRVKTIRDHIKAKIAGQIGGTIDKFKLLAQVGIFADVENLDIDINAPVSSFRLFILHNEKVIFTKQNDSRKFDDEIKQGLKLAETGDTIYFVDIKAFSPDEENRIISLNDITLKIN